MSRVVGLILAGGRGERLGGAIKANLEVGGVRLLARVAAAMASVDATLVSIGRFDPAEINLLPGQIPVPDIDSDYAGPLAGLGAAIAWAMGQTSRPDVLVTAAVDTPFLPEGFASAMVNALADHAGVVAAYGEQPYPTNAAWRLGAIADLPARMVAGTAPHSLKRLAEALDAPTKVWPENGGGDPFANANTPAELQALEARAAAVKKTSSIRHS
jgi:molybdopterin-guanine dinucleotide biosynthesis protein A